MITVYTIAFNEALVLQFMIDHYRKRFPNCKIVVFDNESTDNTVAIAEQNGCQVITYSTNNQISDNKYLEIKNHCWRNADTDWVLVCDVDELLDIDEEQLRAEEAVGSTMIRAEGYNMVNLSQGDDLSQIRHGARAESYDKRYLFNKKFVQNIKYNHGCHHCNPSGHIQLSQHAYPAYHYKYINIDFLIQRYTIYAARLSPENVKHRWGWHYTKTADEVREDWDRWESIAEELF